MKNIILEKYKEMLNEKSILNDEFWKWFGDSKVVDSNGNPLVCYHGTDAKFNEFDYEYIGGDGKLGLGFYFTKGTKLQFNYEYPMSVYLSIKKPIYDNDKKFSDVLNDMDNLYMTIPNSEILKFIEKKYNIDGIIGINRSAVVAFFPNQIKSIDNKGTWSSNTNNIYESIIDTIKYKNETMEIYENPSYNEWKHINNHSRGIISPVGNLYMTNVLENVNAKPSDILHTDILIALFSGQSSKNFVMVEKNNGSIVLSATDRNDPRVKEYFSKCKEKNPHLNFINNVNK